jgi:hypothetical protein
LAVGGALAAQGEDLGSAALGGLAAALGARGGLGAARLAGKYAPELAEAVQSRVLTPAGNALGNIARNLPEEAVGGKRMGAINKIASVIEAAERGLASPRFGQGVQAAAAGFAAPASALAAGLGGVAAGSIPGAMGIPGFQQGNPIDPESTYVNQNPKGLGVSTLNYPG